VSSGSKYAEYLGGSATFSGLILGIPAVVSGMALVPLVRRDGGAEVDVGMTRYLGLQVALLGIGGLMSMTLWKEMKAKTG
jgi:hypothetical protein